MNPLDTINQGLTETTQAVALMQKTLLVFCGLVAISIVVISIAIFRQSSKV